ncbi:hypothetical protein PG987_000224 [Apiospora arundinis]
MESPTITITTITPTCTQWISALDRSRSPELGNGFSSGASIAIHPLKRSLLRFSSPTGSVRSSFSISRRHLASRRFSGASLMRSQRSEVSKELTLQGESEFFALMELMSNISRRSNSLKDIECTEIIESKEREQTQHQHDHEENQKEVDKLRLEISTVLASVNEYKKKLADRDSDLGNARRDLHDYKAGLSFAEVLTKLRKHGRDCYVFINRKITEKMFRLIFMPQV